MSANIITRRRPVIAGVCHQLAEDYEVNTWVIRMVALMFLVTSGTLAVLFYLLLMLFYRKSHRASIERFLQRVSGGTLTYEAAEFLLLASLVIIAIETFIFSIWI